MKSKIRLIQQNIRYTNTVRDKVKKRKHKELLRFNNKKSRT